MTKPIWHSGPPPSLGWWPASICKNDGVYRWWNGEYWSWSVEETSSPEIVAEFSKNKANTGGIKWAHRPKSWPARSMT